MARLSPAFGGAETGLRPRSSQRDPPGHREVHRTAHRNVRGRAGGRVAGPAKPLAFGFSELPLGEIRQFEIVEEQVDKFIAAQNEPECIFAVAFTRPGGFSAAFAGTRKHVTFDEFLVTGKHHVARSAFAAKARLTHPLEWDADLAAFQDILDVAALGRLLDGSLNQRLGTPQEALAVLKA